MLRRFLQNLFAVSKRASALLLGTIADLRFHIFQATKMSWARRQQFKIIGVSYTLPMREGFGIFVRTHGNLSFGARCALGARPQFWNYQNIHIGDDFIAGPDLAVLTGTHDPATLEPIGVPVKIGDRVWCGARVTILPGVTIGDDVIVAAGSVVNRDISSGKIVAGVPAKIIGSVEREMLWRWTDDQS
jgi:acetyltransferase-like isoleucine patch superfamily enzyme